MAKQCIFPEQSDELFHNLMCHLPHMGQQVIVTDSLQLFTEHYHWVCGKCGQPKFGLRGIPFITKTLYDSTSSFYFMHLRPKFWQKPSNCDVGLIFSAVARVCCLLFQRVPHPRPLSVTKLY